MKKSTQKQITDVLSKINRLTRHIRNVEDNCLLLGTKLIEKGEIELGHKIIANGMVHDASKFFGIEFENISYSNNDKEENAKLKLKMAIHHHTSTNPHHPEFWSHISKMPMDSLGECVCDWKARSEEFGTSLVEWINEIATKRYEFSVNDKTYKDIMSFVDLLCEKPFEQK